jgi:hypothetical protein
MRRALQIKIGHIPGERSDLRPRSVAEPRLQGLIFLVLGGVITIVASLFTLFHLNDHDIVRATVPGSLLGFGLFVAFVIRNRSESARGHGRRRSV